MSRIATHSVALRSERIPQVSDVDLVLRVRAPAAKINTGLLPAARFGCRPNG